VLGQRWVSGSARATLEEDLGLANLALDLIGQARLLLTYAGEIEGRSATKTRSLTCAMHRSFLTRACRAAQRRLWLHHRTSMAHGFLAAGNLHLAAGVHRQPPAAIAAKALKETRYHYRFSSGWLVRLGDGTAESHERVATSGR